MGGRPIGSAAHFALGGEKPCEAVGKDGEDKEPTANEEEHGTAPAFDLLRTGAESVGEVGLGGANEAGNNGRYSHNRYGSDGKSSQSGRLVANCKRVQGQTDQNGARSAKASQDVAKAIETVAQHRFLTAQLRLLVPQRLHGAIEPNKVERLAAQLQAAEEKEG